MSSLIIFDVEGTLVDCVPQTLACWQATFLQFGFEVSLAELKRQSGRDPKEMIRVLLPAAEAHHFDKQLREEQGRRYREQYLGQVKPFEGVRSLLIKFRTEGWRIGLATSCAPDELHVYLGLTGVHDLVDVMACGEDVEHEKPHPDLVNIALQRPAGPPGPS
jgi:phosphoglycolate phosphatase-like HAD superfamily hydrolase